MNWIALGHLVKAAGHAFFRETDEEDEGSDDYVPTKSHTQRQPRATRAKAVKRTSPAGKKPCCIAKR